MGGMVVLWLDVGDWCFEEVVVWEFSVGVVGLK